MKHKPLLLSVILTLCVIAISAVLVGHFVHLNYEYIANPETSPCYNGNTPFGFLLLYVLFSLFSFIFMFPMLLLFPAGIVCAIVFLSRKKPPLALHTVLLALSMVLPVLWSCSRAICIWTRRTDRGITQ